MFDNLKNLWENRGFEIMVGVCIFMLLIFGIWNTFKKKKGSWTNPRDFRRSINVSKPHVSKNPTRVYRKPADSKGELECRRVLRKLYGRAFNKCRPDFLKNKALNNNQNLELDCFDEITLADGTVVPIGVEYHGIQHYQYVPFFHGKNKHVFETQKYRDYIKKQMCKDNRVVLIEVSYKVKLENIEEYLINELEKRNLL